ncbi:hypothetical protein [Xenorhabdus szentirmaii]|uniref:Uncharacterized protein n=1 Tax=Xenorhabdus szentirmaii DSM 16338 TaxID=1427518 RepID=W1J022_9GAMM|nr:hypothetical protein [Xenorhabdus szentirmaii]PHM34537.1 hypothetical protein Xsze_00967 [Xenorhabdus szentirmaii DSM 16338]PHM43267.1 hypothetical protein Xszus_03053 [Xenorhabdus szentirmaii]CDL82815.1 conserved hypothetical protein [Xenorhabdus szentirmaii DSM 16338]
MKNDIAQKIEKGKSKIPHPTSVPNCAGKVGDVGVKCNQKFSHQLKLLSIDNQVNISNVPYAYISIPARGFGKTNGEGKTDRIITQQPEEVAVLVGKLAKSYERRRGSFGSLKELEERKISLLTNTGEPTTEEPYISGYDYITVVGARTEPGEASFGSAKRTITTLPDIFDSEKDWQLFTESPGNQYRFINCGLHQLQLFPKASEGDHAVQRIMVVFEQGYTKKDIKRINEYTTGLGGRIVYVKNKQGLINFLNQRKEKKRLIKEMSFFCHGIIDYATFHYKGKDVEGGKFGPEEIEKVYESIFDFDAKITTYACRAGISVDNGWPGDFTGIPDVGQDKSPAQRMANAWDVEVKAFEKRSSYIGIYGTDKETKEYSKVIDKYEADCKAYKYEVSKGNKNAKPPEKPKDYEIMKKRNEGVKVRDYNEDNGGGPIAPNGSWILPGTGDTPHGLKKGLQNYKPIEWIL